MDAQNILLELRSLYNEVKTTDLSEIDTQVLFVEPIIKLGGWETRDPGIVKRASRSTRRQEFDIEIYDSEKLPRMVRIAFECKSLKSAEFNIGKISSRNGIGQLTKKQKERDLTLYWANKSGDGTGQLRAYCVNYVHFDEDSSMAILTNGYKWVIFNNEHFLIESSLSERISDDHIMAHSNICNDAFETEIISKLSKKKD